LRIQSHPVPPPCTEPVWKQDLRIQGLAATSAIAPRLSYFHNATSRCLAALTHGCRSETHGMIPRMMAGHRTGKECEMRALERGVDIRALTEVGTVVVGISDAPHEEHAVQSRAPVSLLLMTRNTPRIRIQTARTARSSTGALRCCPLSHLDDGVVVLGVAALLSRCRRN
jgi:hypothetical protein